MISHDMVSYVMISYDKISYDMISYDMIQCLVSLDRCCVLLFTSWMAAAPEWWEKASQHIIQSQETVLEKHLGPIKKETVFKKTDIQSLKTGQQDLESRASCLEAGGSRVDTFRPKYVDIRWFVLTKKKTRKESQGPRQSNWWQPLRDSWTPRCNLMFVTLNCDPAETIRLRSR